MQNTHIHKALVEKEMAGRQNGNSVPITEKAEKKMVERTEAAAGRI